MGSTVERSSSADVAVSASDPTISRTRLPSERHSPDAIACYPRDAIVDAIAIFTGERTAGTPPAGVDAQYLQERPFGIVHVHQAEPITETLR